MNEYLDGDYRIDNDKPYLHHYDIPKAVKDRGMEKGSDLVVTIAGVKKEKVRKKNGEEEEKQILYFVEDIKPLILNKKVNPEAISVAVGSHDRAVWRGKKIALYEGDESKAEDGKAVRVRPYVPKVNDDELVCEECGAIIEDKTVNGKTYKGRVIAENAKTKFGKYLCYECAQKAKGEI